MVEVLFSEIHILIQFSILSWGVWAEVTVSPGIWLEVIPLIVQKWWFSSLLKYIVSLERLSLAIKITYGDSLPPQCLCWELWAFFLFNKSYLLATMSVCMSVDSILRLHEQEVRFPFQSLNFSWTIFLICKKANCLYSEVIQVESAVFIQLRMCSPSLLYINTWKHNEEHNVIHNLLVKNFTLYFLFLIQVHMCGR